MIDAFFWLKKSVALLSDPTTALFLVLSVLFVLGCWLSPARLKQLLTLTLSLFFLLSTPLVGHWLLSPLEPELTQQSVLPSKTTPIVVLGCGHIEEKRLALVDQYQECSLRRVLHGVSLHQKTGYPLVFSGGVMPNKKESEAAANRRLAMAFGVAEEYTTVVEGAVDTRSESKTLRAVLPGEQVILVTSASHTYRARRYLERVGFEVTLSPADRKIYQDTVDYSQWTLYLPSRNGLLKSQRAIYEYLGILSQMTLE